MPKRSRSESSSQLSTSSSSPSSSDLPTEHSTKYVHTSPSPQPAPISAMKCSLPPHTTPLTFPTPAAFETHYFQAHLNRCSSCQHNFPTAHFLSLHISENHNPLAQARRARGEKTYACFVEGCEKVCSTPQKRRLHLVDKHSFPRNYHFRVVDEGIERRRSMLRGRWRREDARNKDGGEEGDGEEQEMEEGDESKESGMLDSRGETGQNPSTSTSAQTDMDDLTSGMSALRFVPPSVRFGRGGRRRGGFSRS